MGRTAWFDAKGMKKGEWTAEEDRMLVAYIDEHGLGDWRVVPKKAGLQRCGKSCRLRWLNYLRPGIKRGKFTPEEEEDIIKCHALLGNRWAAIAKQMPNRTDNDIKNHWNSCLKKRLARNGIDPMTHEPIQTVEVTSSSTTSSSNLSPCSSFSSSYSARLLNKLASRKHGLDLLIKNVILSDQPSSNNNNGEALEEKKMIMSEEHVEEEAIGCFMEIDENLISPTSFDELPCESTASFLDYSSSFDPYGLHQSDFLETDVQLDMFLL